MSEVERFGITARDVALWFYNGTPPSTELGLIGDSCGTVYVHEGVKLLHTMKRGWWADVERFAPLMAGILRSLPSPKALNMPPITSIERGDGGLWTPKSRQGDPFDVGGEHVVLAQPGRWSLRLPMQYLDAAAASARQTINVTLQFKAVGHV